ncbi:MAG: IclR family transcriptional regulator [Dongiaceae bacterium]
MAASPERSRTAATSIKRPRAKAGGAAGTPAATPGRAPRRARQREASESDGDDRMFVNALARGLEILRVFNPSDGALGNQEIARRTGIPKPTVSRLAYTLTKLGYLIYFPDTRRYQLGPAGLSLGYAILGRLRIRQIARPLMQQLSDEVGASVAIGMRDRLEMLYIAYTHANASVTLRLEAGTRIPMALTAMGRAFLAGLPADERDYLMENLARRFPEDWPRLSGRIADAIRAVGRDGFCLVAGEWQREVNAVAATIRARDELYAISCGAPAYFLPEKRLREEVAPRFLAVVAAIEDRLLIEDHGP